MKQLVVLIIAMFSFVSVANAQVININGVDQILDPKEAEDVPEILQGIQYKKYLTKDYKPAFVDDFKVRSFLRYNIHDDQMEFVKDETIYYLKKDVGRKVRFADKSTYMVYNFDGRPHFFLVHEDGKHMLVAMQVVKFVQAREPNSGYDRGTPPDYKRKRDELFLAVNGKTLVKIPRKKKAFYALFGDKESDVKSYMKKNKLGYKSVEDLKEVIKYFNTL